MSHFAVVREAGPAWTEGKGAFEQPAVADHAAFMSALADEGFVLVAGPLDGSEHSRIRVLLIVDAASEPEVHRRLADDPWEMTGRLETVRVESWNVITGGQRLSSLQTGPRRTGQSKEER
jgi:uncharacterized protein YciI